MFIEGFFVNNQSFIKVTNNDDFEVVLSSNGASIYSIKLDNVFLTQTHISKELHKKGYLGKTIGRVANRIKGNTILVQGVEYKLESNEGPNTLHGALMSLSCFLSQIGQTQSLFFNENERVGNGILALKKMKTKKNF